MLHPSYAELMQVVNEEAEGDTPVVNSRYSIVMATARRARQLTDGAEPMVSCKIDKALSVAVEELNQALQDTQFNTPEIPIYFNVLANVQNDAQQFSDLLLKQLTQSVRWRETIQNIPCENFIECGPGKVLSGLVKRTKDAVQIQDTNTLDAIKKILQAEQ